MILPRRGGREVNIWLFETGSCLSVPGKKWQQWIMPNSPQLGDMHRIETEALFAVLPMIRLRFPTVESLMAAIDWETEAQLSAEAEAAAILAEQTRIDSFSEHNRECKTLAEQLGISGLTCPHCSQRSTNIRFWTRALPKSQYSFAGSAVALLAPRTCTLWFSQPQRRVDYSCCHRWAVFLDYLVLAMVVAAGLLASITFRHFSPMGPEKAALFGIKRFE